EKILGYSPSQWTEDPHFWVNHIHEDDRTFAVEFCHVQTEQGLNHRFEYRMLDVNGNVVWLKDVVSVVSAEDGSRQLIGMMIDVTDKKMTEEQLISKQKELQLLLKSANEGLYGLDTEGRCTFINDAAATMIGIPKEELYGCIIHALTHPQEHMPPDHDSARCPICNPTLLREKHEHHVELFYRPDGTSFDVNYSSIPLIEHEEYLGAVITFADITLQQETNHQLMQAKNTLNKILQQSLDLICTFDRNGRFLNVSHASLKILGYEPEELIGKRYTDFLVPQDVRLTLRTGNLVMQGGSKSNFENRYIRKDGSIVPILWSARWDEEEELMYCTGKDATDLKRAHEKLELSERRFRQLVKGSS